MDDRAVATTAQARLQMKANMRGTAGGRGGLRRGRRRERSEQGRAAVARREATAEATGAAKGRHRTPSTSSPRGRRERRPHRWTRARRSGGKAQAADERSMGHATGRRGRGSGEGRRADDEELEERKAQAQVSALLRLSPALCGKKAPPSFASHSPKTATDALPQQLGRRSTLRALALHSNTGHHQEGPFTRRGTPPLTLCSRPPSGASHAAAPSFGLPSAEPTRTSAPLR